MRILAKKFVISSLRALAALFGLILVIASMRPAKAAMTYTRTVAVSEPAAIVEVQDEPAVLAEPAETVEIDLPSTVQDTLLEVCKAKGYDEACAKTLLGILWKESLGNAKAVGDQGRSRGYFQIRYKLHKISIDCAEDLRCSAEWTLTYLEHNGYPKFPVYATQCHNGCNARNGYAASAKRHGDRLWPKPMVLASK
jgi:hypothetical protein